MATTSSKIERRDIPYQYTAYAATHQNAPAQIEQAFQRLKQYASLAPLMRCAAGVFPSLTTATHRKSIREKFSGLQDMEKDQQAFRTSFKTFMEDIANAITLLEKVQSTQTTPFAPEDGVEAKPFYAVCQDKLPELREYQRLFASLSTAFEYENTSPKAFTVSMKELQVALAVPKQEISSSPPDNLTKISEAVTYVNLSMDFETHVASATKLLQELSHSTRIMDVYSRILRKLPGSETEMNAAQAELDKMAYMDPTILEKNKTSAKARYEKLCTERGDSSDIEAAKTQYEALSTETPYQTLNKNFIDLQKRLDRAQTDFKTLVPGDTSYVYVQYALPLLADMRSYIVALDHRATLIMHGHTPNFAASYKELTAALAAARAPIQSAASAPFWPNLSFFSAIASSVFSYVPGLGADGNASQPQVPARSVDVSPAAASVTPVIEKMTELTLATPAPVASRASAPATLAPMTPVTCKNFIEFAIDMIELEQLSSLGHEIKGLLPERPKGNLKESLLGFVKNLTAESVLSEDQLKCLHTITMNMARDLLGKTLKRLQTDGSLLKTNLTQEASTTEFKQQLLQLHRVLSSLGLKIVLSIEHLDQMNSYQLSATFVEFLLATLKAKLSFASLPDNDAKEVLQATQNLYLLVTEPHNPTK